MRVIAIYQKLRSELRGDQRGIATKKMVACNRELHLPAASGITD